jgi:hypothetical protein
VRMTPRLAEVLVPEKECGEFIAGERAKWGKLITDLKIRAGD